MENKDFLIDDYLDYFTKEFDYTSLLDTADASPSEILADAFNALPPTSTPRSSTDSNNSDTSSDDDFKTLGVPRNSSSDNSVELDEEPLNNLKVEDVEKFLHKTVSNNEVTAKYKHPMMSIDQGVIKVQGLKINNGDDDEEFNDVPTYPNLNQKQDNNISNETVAIFNHDTNMVNQPVHYYLVNQRIINGSNVHYLPTNVLNCDKPLLSSNGDNSVKKTTKEVDNKKCFISNSETESAKIKVQSAFPPNMNYQDSSHYSEAEIKALKKQQRMIRNREAAYQSHQKRKNYVNALEQQLMEAHQEIARLRLENRLLRDQIPGKTRKMPRLDLSLIPKKNIAVVFAMVFMVSFNFNFFGWSPKPVPIKTNHRIARHLLWNEDDSPDYYDSSSYSGNKTGCDNSTSKQECCFYGNQTENLRIVSELDQWVKRGKTFNLTLHPNHVSNRSIYKNGKIPNTIYMLNTPENKESKNFMDFPNNLKYKRDKKLRFRKRREIKDEILGYVLNYATLYHGSVKKQSEHLNDLIDWHAINALEMRDDTFYVFGMDKGHHLLLPPTSYNVTKPPKMALILPAQTSNDTLIMQIDCSIVNTTLVKVHPK